MVLEKNYKQTEVRNPVLSICIPTYNRSEKLERLLKSIEKNIPNHLKSLIEIIISDNSNNDDTSEVVSDFENSMNITYAQNERNIGQTANILKVTELANGTFTWIVGDDDVVVDGFLESLIVRITARKEISAFMLNFVYAAEGEMPHLIGLTRNELIQSNQTISKLDGDATGTWEEIITNYKRPQGFMTSITSHVFRTEEWKKHLSNYLKINLRHQCFSSCETTFPYLIIWIKILSGKKVYFVHQPSVLFTIGNQKWIHRWSFFYFHFLLEIYEGMKESFDSGFVDELIKNHFNQGVSLFDNYLSQNNPIGNVKLLRKLIKSYSQYPSLWKMLSFSSVRKARFRLMVLIFGFHKKYFYSIYLRR